MDNVQSEPETNSALQDPMLGQYVPSVSYGLREATTPPSENYYRREAALQIAVSSVSGMSQDQNNIPEIIKRAKAFYAFTTTKTRVRK